MKGTAAGLRRMELVSTRFHQEWTEIEPSIWSHQSMARTHSHLLGAARTLFDQPRWLEPSYLYDAKGSHLFDRICELPEYYLTRTENALLQRHAEEICALAGVTTLVELGSGFARKTRHLLKAIVDRGESCAYLPVDVSRTALAGVRELLAKDFPEISLLGLQSLYEEALRALRSGRPKLVAFLGSSLGNFTRTELLNFFQMLEEVMSVGDSLLLGVDRVKEKRLLERAYNDSQELTAAFILNVFAHLNRISECRFDLSSIEYRGYYNEPMQQMELTAVTLEDQKIHFAELNQVFHWRKGESILVEISRKFDPQLLQQQLQLFQFEPVGHYTDDAHWFSLLLLRRRSSMNSTDARPEPDSESPQREIS